MNFNELTQISISAFILSLNLCAATIQEYAAKQDLAEVATCYSRTMKNDLENAFLFLKNTGFDSLQNFEFFKTTLNMQSTSPEELIVKKNIAHKTVIFIQDNAFTILEDDLTTKFNNIVQQKGLVGQIVGIKTQNKSVLVFFKNKEKSVGFNVYNFDEYFNISIEISSILVNLISGTESLSNKKPLLESLKKAQIEKLMKKLSEFIMFLEKIDSEASEKESLNNVGPEVCKNQESARSAKRIKLAPFCPEQNKQQQLVAFNVFFEQKRAKPNKRKP